MELALSAGETVYWAWFTRSVRDDLFSLDELSTRYRLEQVASPEDGAVYVVRPRIP